MDEQTQAEFLEWLSKQLGVTSENELQEQISNMGDEGIQQAFELFTKEKQTPMNKQGGKLDYLYYLRSGGTMKKNGIIKDEGKDDKTAVGITKWIKGEDDADALGGRKDSGKLEHTAIKKLKQKGKDGKTAVGKTKWVKGEDNATALNRRHDSGKSEHTTLNGASAARKK